jgi:hypothetical protein
MQNFTVTLTDASGKTATVAVGDKKYGEGLQQSVGNITARMHVILRENRIPISDFTDQGLDASKVRSIAFDFGGAGMPATGSIQLANVRFIRTSNAPVVAALKSAKRAKASAALPDVKWVKATQK